jgi:hypothetical protein
MASTPSPATQKLIDRASYLASRGPSGMGALKGFTGRHRVRARKANNYPGAIAWFQRIPLHGAATNRWVDTMAYMCDHLKSSLDTITDKGTALHQSVIWGHTTCVVWLLERGADYTLVNGDGDTPLQLAVKRQGKFGESAADSKKDMSEEEFQLLVKAGRELIRILACVEEHGYRYFARKHPGNEFVQEHSQWAVREAARADVAVLRALVSQKGRATIKSLQQVKSDLENEAVRLAQEKELTALREKRAAQGQDAEEKGLTLEDLMEQDGCLDLIHGLHAMDVRTPGDLRCVERQMVAKVERLNSKERRQLWLFVKAQKAKMDELPEAVAADKKEAKKTLREQRRMQAEENQRNRELEESYRAVNILYSERMPDAMFKIITQMVY